MTAIFVLIFVIWRYAKTDPLQSVLLLSHNCFCNRVVETETKQNKNNIFLENTRGNFMHVGLS